MNRALSLEQFLYEGRRPSKEMFETIPNSLAIGGIDFRRGRPYLVPYGNLTVPAYSVSETNPIDEQSIFARTVSLRRPQAEQRNVRNHSPLTARGRVSLPKRPLFGTLREL